MKIIVEGHEIETKEITSIEEAGWRRHGFIITLIGNRKIDISIPEKYDMRPSECRIINDRYRRLRNKVEEMWEKDKTDVPIFNL